MNVYMIDISGAKQLWKAETPTEAIELSKAANRADYAEADATDPDDPPDAVWERTFRSCERVGKLENP